MFNPRLPKALLNTSTEGRGLPPLSLDFRYKASDSYDFGTKGCYGPLFPLIPKEYSSPLLNVTMII